MRIHADRTVCVGSGMCALTAPTVFDQDDAEGRVSVLDATPADETDREAARDAVDLCPAGALSIE